MNDTLDVVLRLVAVLAVFLVLPLLVGQAEHKVMAHMQGRLGPMYAGGFHGWAQLVADGVKFAQKEDVVPADADRRIFQLAPAVALLPYLLVLIAIPVGPHGFVGQALDAGLFFVLAVMGVGVLGSLMAGWASRQQVLAARRPAHGRAADGVRTADAARRGLGRDGRRHPVAARDRRSRTTGGGRCGSSWAAWCSSPPGSPSCNGRRSTCRSPTRRSSSARTPSTPGCASRCSCSPSTPGSSCCAR